MASSMTRIIRKKLWVCLLLLIVLLLVFTEVARGYSKQALTTPLDGLFKCMGNSKVTDTKTGWFEVVERIENLKYTMVDFKKGKQDGKVDDDGFLILTLIQSRRSFGGGRNFKHYLELLGSLEYPNKEHVVLGLLIGNAKLFDNLVKHFTDANDLIFSRITLYHAPFIQDSQTSRGNRHDNLLQKVRRRQLARLRNFLMIRSFGEEQHVLWIDSDVEDIKDKQILLHFLQSGKDIIVPRISEADNGDYDLNSWRGIRTEPDKVQAKLMDSNQWDKVTFMPEDKQVFHFSTFLKEQASSHKEPDYVTPLDSVGSAFLYIRLEILQQGVNFPAYHAVGTNWRRNEGYDGIESEGLCYVARVLGYTCWGMPNQVAVHAI